MQYNGLNRVSEKLISILKGHRVFIQTHDCPDPDAIGAAHGLKVFLSNFGIKSEICCNDLDDSVAVEQMLLMLNVPIEDAEDIVDEELDGYTVLMDVQEKNGNLGELSGEVVACIDHHVIIHDCDYRFCDIRRVGAASSIVVSYFKEFGLEIPKETATELMYGIKMDTADFTRGAQDFDGEMFAYALSYADKGLISELHNNSTDLES